jgi:predicted acyl esterase
MATAGEGMHYEVLVERDIKVAMRDGIKLACDGYRPARGGEAATGTFPVILERTPYGKSTTSRSEISRHHPEQPYSRADVAAFFVQHGLPPTRSTLIRPGRHTWCYRSTGRRHI